MSIRRKRRKLRHRKIEDLVGIGFVVCIMIFAIINILTPTQESSERENRTLAQKPTATWTSILSGNYMEQYEEYQADQFFARDFWRSVKLWLNRFSGSRKENGVYIGKDGYLLEDIVIPDRETLQINLDAIESFAKEHEELETSMILVPDAANVLKEKLPAFVQLVDQSRYMSRVKKQLSSSLNWIDAEAVMNKHKDEKIYYKTDHHWTTKGAYYVFQEAAKVLDLDYEKDGYVFYPVTKTFNGTLAAKSGYRLDENEEIGIYVPQIEDKDLIVNYVEEQRKTASLYDSSKLEERDKYGVYLGGNSPLIDIQTVSESERRLLIFKDSYANCFVPFLTPYFREIVLVDPRYYTGTIEDIMQTYQFTDVLFLYSGNMFFQDNNINGVINGE